LDEMPEKKRMFLAKMAEIWEPENIVY